MALSVEQLVEQQLRKWEGLHRAADRPREPAPSAPAISVSRAYGSQGAEIGRQAAERLGFDVFDRTVVDQIASQAQVRASVVASVEQGVRDRISKWLGEQFGGGFFAESEYLRNLSRVMRTIARHGRAVIIGRGSQFILDPCSTLRVRIFAPLEQRVRYVAEVAGLTLSTARAQVLQHDAERAAFCRRHFDRDIRDPAHYDLLVSTEHFTVETATTVVEHAFRARFAAAAER